MNRMLYAFENRFFQGLRAGAGLFLVLTLLAVAGCSTDGSEEEADAEYPNINTVPETPAAAAPLSEAEDITEGLRADRENARYTDETLRADTSVQPPPAMPAKPAVTEVVEEKITETVKDGETTVTETVTTVTEEKVPQVAAAAQEPVTEEPLPAPTVAETTDTAPTPAPTSERIISGDTAAPAPVESVFQQQLAASSVTRLPDGTSGQGSSTVVTERAAPEPSAPAPSSDAQGQPSRITLTPPTADG
ncbi:MAG: hypothetical protein WDZ54_02780, partial [Sneathiella sp.]